MTNPSDTLIDRPPGAQAPAEDPLRAFLSGKRQGERHACHLAVTLEGLLAPVAATALDLSTTGALVQIDEPAFLESEELGGTQAYLELLSLHSKEGLTLQFASHGPRVPAEVVRWTAGEAGQGVSRVGLRFGRALSDDEVRALRTGTPAREHAGQEQAERGMADRWDADVSVSVLPLVPCRGATLEVFVFHAQRPAAGPLIVGRALGAGPAALAVRLSAHRPVVEVAGLLAGNPLEVVLQERGGALHVTSAHVAWILPVDGGGCVDVGLTLDHALEKRALARWRKA